MAFDPRDWLAIASHLLTVATPEEQSRFRTAINRAYYAPLILLKRRVEDAKGSGTVPERGVHGALRKAMRDTKIFHLQKVEKKLEALQIDRESADYSIGRMPYDVREVEDAIERGKKLVKDIESIPVAKLRRLQFG